MLSLVSALVVLVVLLVVLLIILLLIFVLIVHFCILQLFLAVFRGISVPYYSGFILCFKQNTGDQTGYDRGCNAACACF